jgi:hypothetical protein
MLHTINPSTSIAPFGQDGSSATTLLACSMALLATGMSASSATTPADPLSRSIAAPRQRLVSGATLLTGEPIYPENRGVDHWLNAAAFKNLRRRRFRQTDMSPLGTTARLARLTSGRSTCPCRRASRSGHEAVPVACTCRTCSIIRTSRHRAEHERVRSATTGVTDFRNLLNFGKLTAVAAAE